jgi:hypothetical protein
MAIKFGFYLFLAGFSIALFTSNIIVSKKERMLAELYKSQKQRGLVCKAEHKYAYLNIMIAKCTRWLMGCGLTIIVGGYFLI